MIAKCKGCGQKNRIALPSPGVTDPPRYRCGKCKQEFTEEDLMEAAIAETLGGLGATGVRWDTGGGFDFP